MKMISEITVRVKSGGFLSFIEDIQEHNCSIQRLNCIEKGDDREVYVIDLVYENRELFSDFVHAGGKKYKIEGVSNVLEEKIRGGLITTAGKIPFETYNDYQINLLGATELMYEKIREGRGRDYTGICRNIGIISGIKAEREDEDDMRMKLHVLSELAAVVINRFSGFNAFPAIVRFQQPEDLIKIIQSVENSFTALKLVYVDEADISFYSQIKSDLSIPVISDEIDIVPIYLLTMILKMFKKNKISPSDTTIGLLGVDTGAIRLTQLLVKLGCMRVLGYDHNEKSLLSFEHMEGLATTADNIFTNADIVVLLKENFSREEFQKARPGQCIVSLIGEDHYDRDFIAGRGVRDYISINKNDMLTLVPGLMKGIIDSSNKTLDDLRMIEFCRKLVNVAYDDYSMPDAFSDIHSIVSDLISPAVMHRV
ncbi:MAG TPA: hypothetical protein PK926_12260 [Spirochaetota bacterium]|nr:hypothetical protein [Spirochaetota bacterium]HPI89731.1 hypothetical protein [Spirochaetota bacterium]HPR46636.1 hypothetical protein [Spirochaetota bacterium]